MSTVGIVGSGFGLYGYLPALVEVGKMNVILPGRYKDKFLARSELKIYADYIHWVSDDGDHSHWVENCRISFEKFKSQYF